MDFMYLGLDPDLHRTAIALVDEHNNLVGVGCCRVSAKKKGIQACLSMIGALEEMWHDWFTGQDNIVAAAIEGQDITYTAKRGANPNDILKLAPISGAACAYARVFNRTANIYMPKPVEWKGSKPKLIHHKHICKFMLGWEYEEKAGYVIPDIPDKDKDSIIGLDTINPSDWKHIMDAVGLAYWARESYRKNNANTAILS